MLFDKIMRVSCWFTPPPNPLPSQAGEGESNAATKSPSLTRLERGI
jgi:hypothetical protein